MASFFQYTGVTLFRAESENSAQPSLLLIMEHRLPVIMRYIPCRADQRIFLRMVSEIFHGKQVCSLVVGFTTETDITDNALAVE
jgi:type II secretory pathway predicted ATPase ExeA